MALYKPGTVCSVRGSDEDWQILGTQHDGLVLKYVVQSRNSGEIRCLFNFEVFEKYTSTYQDINEFFKAATGYGLDENFDFLDEDIDQSELETVERVIDVKNESEATVLNQPKKRFKTASESDILQLKAQNTEKTTDNNTKWAVNLLKVWMSENHFENGMFEYFDPQMLDSVLQQFYASLQSKKGGHYSKSALVGIRAGLNRHLTTPPFSRQMNLMNDREYMASNQVLTGLIKGLKREGKDVSKNKEPISEYDHNKLYECGVFSVNKPETLQNKVIYEIIAQFGRRGREGLHTLKKESFVIRKDVKGRRYLTMAYNEVDKTHHGLDSREKAKEPRMYESNDEFCPLSSYEKYVSKLHHRCDRLFQRPQRLFRGPDSDVWYENSPIGVNKINNFMANLSKAAGLSQRYTNHCIRAFVSSHLHGKGFSNEAIMSVTGHRNVQSLTSYIKPHDDEKHSISKALTYKSKDPSTSQSCSELITSTVEENETQLSATPIQVQLANSCTSVSTTSLADRKFNIFSGSVHASTINVNVYNSN